MKVGTVVTTTNRVDSALIEPRSFVGLVISLCRAKNILRYLAYTHKELVIGLTEMLRGMPGLGDLASCVYLRCSANSCQLIDDLSMDSKR